MACAARHVKGMTMQRTLSSDWTFFEKFIVPALCLIGFGLGTCALYLANNHVGGKGGVNSILEVRWIFLVVVLLAAASVYWFCIRLKQVRIDDEALYISNYLKEVRVPLRDIAEVTE